jgi:hypothetical protein
MTKQSQDMAEFSIFSIEFSYEQETDDTLILNTTVDLSVITPEELKKLIITTPGLLSVKIKDRYSAVAIKGGLFDWKLNGLINKLIDKLTELLINQYIDSQKP